MNKIFKVLYTLLILSSVVRLSVSAEANKIRIAMIPTCEASSPGILIEASQEVSPYMTVDLFGAISGRLPSALGVDLSAYDLVFVVGNSPNLIHLKDSIEIAKQSTKVVIIEPVILDGNVDLSQYTDIDKYYLNRCKENFKRLMIYLGVEFCGLKKEVEPPVVFPNKAIYHPDATDLFNTADEYLYWYQNQGKGNYIYSEEKPTIGVLFYKTDYTKENFNVLNAVIRSIEEKNCNVLAFYAKRGDGFSDLLFSEEKPLVDVIISFSDQINWKSIENSIARLGDVNVPVLYAPSHYYKTKIEWENSPEGFGLGMISSLSRSEMNGMFEPIMIGARETSSGMKNVKQPIDHQIEWRVNRALAWAKLKHLANKDKKIAITYYSEGGGKGNIGADIDYYLNAQASLVNLFKEMSQRGYDLGSDPLPDTMELSSLMAEKGSNVGVWNAQEIQKRVEEGSVELVSYEEYSNWFDELDEEKRKAVEDKWGPAPGNIMTYENEDGKFIVIPKLVFGNVVLVPHSTWGCLQDKDVLYSENELPPHHQYIALWFWMNRKLHANAVITVFSQISLMPGKQRGLSSKDWGGLLMQDMPNIHPFPLQANSGLHNKRKANALVINYMPTIVTSELYEELFDLKSKIELYDNAQEGVLKKDYAKGIVEEVVRLKLDADLGIDVNTISSEALIGRLNEYLDEVNSEHMPYGPHILGEPPQGEALVEMVLSMLGDVYRNRVTQLSTDKNAAKAMLESVVLSGAPIDQAQEEVLGLSDAVIAKQLELAQVYSGRIAECKNEIPRIADALEGKYIFPGPMDDPIRNPDSLPTGRNPQGLDSRMFPTEEAWQTGKTLVDQMLEQHLEKNGEYPDKVAFVLWSSEITKNHGVLESEILYLLGVKPVWLKGRVKDIELIDRSVLGRPRIDVMVTASGLYRDHFQEKIVLLDKAVRMASEQTEADNVVRNNSSLIEEELLRLGYEKEKAGAIATLRIFSEALGAYSPNIQFAVPAGDTWKNDEEISDLYMSRVSYAYGENVKGEHVKDVFRRNLMHVDAGVFGRSSNVYGILEHPMVAAYFGGLKMAVRNTNGKNIDMYITNLRNADDAKVETLDHFYNRELRSRYFNPKWIKGMMEHGYDGARYMESFSENLWVWDVTSPDMVTEDNWNSVYEVYVKDKYDLGTKAYFDEQNPYALQNMISTMFEVKEKGYWNPSKEVFEDLVKAYAESVAAHGVSGSYGSTDQGMHKDVTEVLKTLPDLAPGLIREYQSQVQQYAGKLEVVKGYEIHDVENQLESESNDEMEKPFRFQLVYVFLLIGLGLLALGWFRGSKVD